MCYNYRVINMKLNEFKFKKQLGQNFLKDNNILNNIVNSAPKTPNSLVIEIGCGSGMLTKKLCENFSYVVGFEIDNELKPYLADTLKEYNNYEILYEDFLQADLINILQKYKYDSLYIIANVPYYITTPIVKKIIDSKLNLEQIILMIQKEVADRFTAHPKTKNYNSLTIYLNYYFSIKKLFIVSKNSFIPKPNVDSIVISLTPKQEKQKLINEEVFFKLVKDSFRYKRKTLGNNLKGYDLAKVEEVLKKYNLTLSVRAEELDISIFSDIANNLSI